MTNTKLKNWEIALMAAFLITLCFGTRTQARYDRLCSGIVRMHVVAQSDSEYEQALKMRVQSRALQFIAPELADCSSAEQAAAKLEAMLPEIERRAMEVSEGRVVRAELGTARYGLSETEGLTLPAGIYRSLRLYIGEAQGHNWWGVIFPQLGDEGGYVDAASLPGQDTVRILPQSQGYELRFKIVELWKELFG